MERRGGGFGLTQCGSIERHDAVEWERSGLKLHVLVAGLHLHSSLKKTTETNKDVNQQITTVTVTTTFIHYSEIHSIHSEGNDGLFSFIHFNSFIHSFIVVYCQDIGDILKCLIWTKTQTYSVNYHVWLRKAPNPDIGESGTRKCLLILLKND